MPYSGKPVGGGRKNFKGCMESINYNGDNITDLARRKKLDTSSFVRKTCWILNMLIIVTLCIWPPWVNKIFPAPKIIKQIHNLSDTTDPSEATSCVCHLSLPSLLNSWLPFECNLQRQNFTVCLQRISKNKEYFKFLASPHQIHTSLDVTSARYVFCQP